MRSKTIKWIIALLILVALGGLAAFIMFFGIMRRPEKPYKKSEAEIKFAKDFKKETNAVFLFSSPAEEVERNKQLKLHVLSDGDSLNLTSKLNEKNIKKYSDSLFAEFIKIYPQSRKATVDSIYMHYDLINVDTAFVYKVR